MNLGHAYVRCGDGNAAATVWATAQSLYRMLDNERALARVEPLPSQIAPASAGAGLSTASRRAGMMRR